MAVIESPLSKALQGGLIQRSVTSSSVFGGGLRLNPVSSGPDLQTLAIANQNTSDISSIKTQIGDLQQQIDFLIRQNTQLVSDVGELSTVKRQVNNLQNQITSLNTTVIAITTKPDTSGDRNLKLESDIVESNNTILVLKNQIEGLREQNRQIILGVTNNITQVQQQVNGLQEQVSDFSSALERIAVVIANSSALDQQRSQYENEQERRSSEIGLRRGKERALESRIQDALTEPIKRIGGKLQLGLGNLLQALYWVFGGWLTNQVINLLTAYSTKNWELFDKIKEAIVRNTLIAVRGLAFVKTGIFKLIGGILDLAKMIGRFLIINPVRALFKGARDLLTGGKTAAAGAKLAGEGTEAATRAGTKLASEGAEAAAKKGGFKFLGRLIPGLQQILGGIDVAQNLFEGDLPGAGLAAGSMLPGPFGYGFLAAGLGYETIGPGAKIAEQRSKGISVKDQKEALKPPQSSPQQSAVPSITPTTVAPKPSETLAQPQSMMVQSSVPPMVSVGAPTSPIQSTTISTPATPLTPPMGSFGVDTSGQFNVFKDFNESNITPAQTQSIPSSPPPGPEPPAKPNIVYTQTGTSKPNLPDTPEPNRGGPVSEVPFILPFDPDNFYTLYSQVNYNVIPT